MPTRKRTKKKAASPANETQPPLIKESGMVIKDFAISDLIASEYNPRRMTLAQKMQLRDSLEEFGLVEPLVVNVHPTRTNILIGGHQRLEILKEQGHESCKAVVVSLPLEQEKKLNLRLNKNNGDWDVEKLAEFFEGNELSLVGFTDVEVGMIFGEHEDDTKQGRQHTAPAKLQFSPRMNHSQEYFLITCESASERDAIQARLDLPDVRSSTGAARGLQRIIPAKDFLARL